jgi:6,7-dimethyl-8-ribityllumazine synthase
MPRILQGQQQQADGRFAIVVSRYNETITSKLLDGALETLASQGVDDAHVVVAWVPGAWEIPLVAKRLVQTGGYAAVLCLGAVIRGETTHDQYINQQLSNSLGELAMESGVPVAFGVLTCNSMEQAIHRAGGNVGNKGVECAEAALEMVHLLSQIDDET